jgi:hypothetical protein
MKDSSLVTGLVRQRTPGTLTGMVSHVKKAFISATDLDLTFHFATDPNPTFHFNTDPDPYCFKEVMYLQHTFYTS